MIEFTDRYQATGTPYPDEDSCGECDGMGLFPVRVEALNKEACESPSGRLLIIGQTQEGNVPMEDDGWVIVQCPHCDGTRKRSAHKEPND